MQGSALPLADGEPGRERAFCEWDSQFPGYGMHLRSVYRDGWLCTVYEPTTEGQPNGLEEVWGDAVLNPCSVVYEQSYTGPGGVGIATGELYNVDDDPAPVREPVGLRRPPLGCATTSSPTSMPACRRRCGPSR